MSRFFDRTLPKEKPKEPYISHAQEKKEILIPASLLIINIKPKRKLPQ
jgi:hypothetical protein